jgi:hypothetical protein
MKLFPWKFSHSSIENSQMIFYAHSSIKKWMIFFMVETKLNKIIFHGWNNQHRWNFLTFFILKCHQISFRKIHPFCHELSSTKVMNEGLYIPQYDLMNCDGHEMNFEWIILEMKWISIWYSMHEICLILKQPKIPCKCLLIH